MPELTLTQRRQAEERAEAEARAQRRKTAKNKPPAESKVMPSKGSYQQILKRSANPNDPSLRGKKQQQKIQSFSTPPGTAVKFSDQE